MDKLHSIIKLQLTTSLKNTSKKWQRGSILKIDSISSGNIARIEQKTTLAPWGNRDGPPGLVDLQVFSACVGGHFMTATSYLYTRPRNSKLCLTVAILFFNYVLLVFGVAVNDKEEHIINFQNNQIKLKFLNIINKGISFKLDILSNSKYQEILCP